MPLYIILLRGINVGGHKKIKMAELSQLLRESGYKDIRTYIQTGNILLRGEPDDEKALANSIANKINAHYGFEVPVIVRTLADLEKVLINQPFTTEDTSKLLVTFLSEEPSFERIQRLETLSLAANDEFQIIGREVFLHCPTGYGRSKLTNDFWERKLAVQATTRNWKTTNKLVLMGRELI